MVTTASGESRSPTPALLLGLIVTLAAVVGVSWYVTRQISGLRALQTDLADRNRTDSLQLLRIQNDLNSLALAMRDMLDGGEPYPLTAWSAQFARKELLVAHPNYGFTRFLNARLLKEQGRFDKKILS